jgi:hypothetical protein
MNSKILSSKCDKHGEVLSATLSLSHKENGILKIRHYCSYCLADIFDSLQKSFNSPKLTVIEEIEKQNIKESEVS